MIKKGIILLVIIVGYALTKPSMLIPYPYTLPKSPDTSTSSQVLIIGDEFAKNLDNYVTYRMINDISKYLTFPLSVTNIAENEGLHRTIARVKSIKKLPPVVIYFGGTSELYESKFNTNDRDKILKNFKTYARFKGLITKISFLSRLFYFRTKTSNLTNFINKSPESDLLLDMEIATSMFQNEFLELQDYIESNNSTLITISLPINRLLPPRKVCADTFYEQYRGNLNNAKDLVLKKNYQASHKILSDLIKIYPANSEAYYLLGMSLLGLNKQGEAFSYLNMAAGLDCSLWRGNPIFNTILKNHAHRFIDFDKMVPFTKYLTSNPLPPRNFYDTLGKVLVNEITDILDLRVK